MPESPRAARRNTTARHRILPALCFLLALAQLAAAQSSFVNFEAPQTKPIAVATVAERDYLLVCNTPDNSVEIYDTTNNNLLQRVPVGLAPVSVKYEPVLQRFYTCNFLGDSVSMVRFRAPAKASSSTVPKAYVERTVHVGDEPCDLTFDPNHLYMWVTLASRSAVAWVSTITLQPVGGDFGRRINLTFPILSSAAKIAIKEPRRLHLTDDYKIFALNYKGGNSGVYDYDLLAIDITRGKEVAIGGLGSTNAGMAIGLDGRIYVVGTMARNELLGEKAVAASKTGFVESHVYVLEKPFDQKPVIWDRDLNQDTGSGNAVRKDQALAQPSDVVLVHDGNLVRKVYVTAFHSDRLAVFTTGGQADPSKWKLERLAIPATTGYPMAGPRALAHKTAKKFKNDVGDRIYCLNQLSNSVTVVDTTSDRIIGHFKLGNDPTPAYIRQGREFLYSAKKSGSGFVSCASCHVDGRTDQLSWNLGDLVASKGAPVPPVLIDGITGQEPPPTEFPPNKGPMMTQSLQGLVNHHIESVSQPFLGNQPYHWRADRASFLDFNGAFVSLMNAKNVGTSSNPKGLTDTEMRLFEQMVNSITYPPNPEQAIERAYSGKLGDPDLQDGSGAVRGMKLFHTFPFQGGLLAGRSCVQCHSLPDSSNNRLTLVDNLGATGDQPIESAATRYLFSREGMLETKANSLSLTRTSQFGLLHNGHSLILNAKVPEFVALSTNWFMFFAFSPAFAGPNVPKLVDLIDFMRQFDTGIAPVVGATETVNAKNKSDKDVTWFLGMVERQATLAHCGVSAYLRTRSGESGFFYDVSMGVPAYRDVHGSRVLSRSALLALLGSTDDVLVVQAVPIGSERRVASLKGVAPLYRGAAPSKLTLEPMTPNAAWADVPKLTKNWTPGSGAHDFKWDGKFPSGKPVPTPLSMKTLRIYQQALIAQAPKLGLTAMRHEAPRRFRVAGNNIRHGARLRFWIPRRINPKVSIKTLRRYQEITVNLFPTSQRTLDGRRIWESQAETDPLFTYMLMLGGPDAPGVNEALNGTVTEPPPKNLFDPSTWNSYRIQVINEDSTFGFSTTAQQIRIK